MADLQPQLDVAAHEDGGAQGATHSAIGAFKRPRDGRITDRPDHHAVQDDGRDHKSIEIDTPEGPLTLHVTPKAPEAGTTLQLTVNTVPAGERRTPRRVSEAVATDDDRAVKNDGGTGKVTAVAAPGGEGSALARLAQVENALVEVRTIDDAKGLRDMAVAIEVVGRKVLRSREVVFKAAETRILAEQAVGKMLQKLKKSESGRPSGNLSMHTTGLDTLTAIGISRDHSSDWQKLADLPPRTLASYFDKARKHLRPATTSGAVRLAEARAERAARRDAREDARPNGWPPSNPEAGSIAREEVEGRAPRPVPAVGTRDGGEALVRDDHDYDPVAGSANGAEARVASDVVGGRDEPRTGAVRDDVGEHPVGKRRRPIAPTPARAVRDLLRELREHALTLEGDELRVVVREVEGLATELSERLQAEREVEPEFDVAPPSDEEHADRDVNDAGERWEEVE